MIIYSQNFNGLALGNLAGQNTWVDGGAGSANQVLNSGYSGNCEGYVNIAGASCSAFRDIPVVTRTTTFSFKLYHSSGDTGTATRFYGDKGFNNVFLADLFYNGTSGNRELRLNNNVIQAFSDATWYSIDVEVNFDTQLAKIQVNGGGWSSGYSFMSAQTQIDKININHAANPGKSATGKVDDISISTSAVDFNDCSARYANWHLNESTGTSASDSSGNAHTGTLQNMEVTDWQPGKLNNCLVFGGTDEYVDTNNTTADFERTDAFSVEYWFKTTYQPSSGQYAAILSKYDATNVKGWMSYYDQNQLFSFLLASSISNYLHVRTTNTQVIWDGSWHHLVATYTGSSTPGGVSVYVDGQLQPLTTITNTLSATIKNSINFRMARDSTGFYYTGSLDEVTIYTRALSEAEVVGRYNAGTGTEGCRYPLPSSGGFLSNEF